MADLNKGSIVCLDFDGVCHSYPDEWTGIASITGVPTKGLTEWLREAKPHARIALFSSRFNEPQGREAVMAWWEKWQLPKVEYWTRKPPALVTIDDRALTFMGRWDDFPIGQLLKFRPWNRAVPR